MTCEVSLGAPNTYPPIHQLCFSLPLPGLRQTSRQESLIRICGCKHDGSLPIPPRRRRPTTRLPRTLTQMMHVQRLGPLPAAPPPPPPRCRTDPLGPLTGSHHLFIRFSHSIEIFIIKTVLLVVARGMDVDYFSWSFFSPHAAEVG